MICSREMSERQFLEQQGSFAREEIFVASVNQAGLVGSGRSSGVNFLRLWGLCCDVGMVMERKGVMRSPGRVSGCMVIEMWSCWWRENMHGLLLHQTFALRSTRVATHNSTKSTCLRRLKE